MDHYDCFHADSHLKKEETEIFSNIFKILRASPRQSGKVQWFGK